jgi:K+-transporting ATPase ATPase C chain
MNTENNRLVESSFAGLTRASLGLTIVALGLCGFVIVLRQQG